MNKESCVTVWILGDQLLLNHPALLAAEEVVERSKIKVVLIESAARLTKLPYHRKKLVLLLSAMRHYAEALRHAGYHVEYIQAKNTLAGLRQQMDAHQPELLITMAAAEYGGRLFQETKLSKSLKVKTEVLPNTQFLVGCHNPYEDRPAGKRAVMENFYRGMRRHFDILMDDDGEPTGGQWNFDKENRKPLPKGGLNSPTPIAFEPDGITRDATDVVNSLDHGIGSTEGFALAVTHDQAQAALDDFIENRLTEFGPFEDAMSSKNGILFHSLLSPYLNLGLLDPLDLIQRAERAYEEDKAPINSVEGFVRQILGWREYVYWQYWQQMPDLLATNSWDHRRSMPQLFWDGKTEMACLHHVVERLLEDGYSHHIERLMLICNFCMLTGIDPKAVHEWFLSFYIDAYEWVVAPNVIGMGLNADGGKTATKPYVASANYINKMSDYCVGCRYNPKERTGEDACPYNYLYWNFLLENEEKLRANPRSGPAVLGLRHLDEAERKAVRNQATIFLDELTYYP